MLKMAPLWLFVSCGLFVQGHVTATGDKGGRVYLSVSSLAQPTPRLLEINWHGVRNDTVNNSVANLFGRDDADSPWTLLESHPVTSEYGTIRTNRTFPLIIFTPETLNTSDECQKYKVSLMRTGLSHVGDVINEISSSCIKGNPNWLRTNCHALSNFRLYELMLPGTHNSGMYDSHYPEIVLVLEEFIDNQEDYIFSQLVYGIRFLDIRVTKYADDYWVTHDVFKGQLRIRELLQAVKSFVEATGEPVVLDFHRFTNGFEKSNPDHDRNHEALAELILEELSDVIMFKHVATMTLGELLGNCSGTRSPRTVIVSYNSDFLRGKNEYFLPGARHLWADASSMEALKSYLEDRICTYVPGIFTAAMAEMTAKFPNFMISNRNLAQQANGIVTRWFREEWWRCANVVATDYFLGNDIINVAMEANQKRAEDRQDYRRSETP